MPTDHKIIQQFLGSFGDRIIMSGDLPENKRKIAASATDAFFNTFNPTFASDNYQQWNFSHLLEMSLR